MTIDEAIEKHRKIAETQKTLYDACALKKYNRHFLKEYKGHEQLAEWLEELKSYRTHIFSGDMTQKMLKEVYKKAIDDLSNKICMHFADWQYSEEDKCIKDIIELAYESVEEIAEQLKAGGADE